VPICHLKVSSIFPVHFVCRFTDSRGATAGKKLAASYGHIVSITRHEGATNFVRHSMVLEAKTAVKN